MAGWCWRSICRPRPSPLWRWAWWRCGGALLPRALPFFPLAPHLGGEGRGERSEPQHVLHGIESGLAAGGPAGGAQRATGEDLAAGGLVGELDPLALGGEDHAMLAHHIAAAQRGEADGPALPRTGDAV